MSRYVVALDPPAAISGRVQLELNEGAIQVDEGGIDWGEAAIKAFLAEARYGEGPSDFRIPNRSITLPLGLGMVNAGTIPEQLASQEKARRELSEKVALLQRQGGVLLRQREGGDPMYADIVNASLTIPDRYAETGGIEPGGSLKLECLPDFYGEELSLPIMEEAEQITGAIRGVLGPVGGELRVLDPWIGRTESPLSYGGKWALRIEDTDTGEVGSEGWEARATSVEGAGAYWVPQSYGNVVVAAVVSRVPGSGQSGFSLWAAANPGELSGYSAFIRREKAPATKLQVEINRWKPTGGVRLAVVKELAIPAVGDRFALRVNAGVISIWHEHAGTWTELCKASDATYTSGYIGMESGEHGALGFALEDFAVEGALGAEYPVVAGDYPARCRIVLTSSANQRALLWGVRSEHFPSKAELEAKTADLTYKGSELSPFNGAEGGEIVVPVVNEWWPFLSTDLKTGEKQLTHLGSYRVWARVWVEEPLGQKLRLAWGLDDATAPIYNKPVTLIGGWQLVDLGEINIERPAAGETHWWRGYLSAWVTTLAAARTFQVDRIWLQPLDEGAGRLQAVTSASPALASQTREGTLANNEALHAGKNWTIAGSSAHVSIASGALTSTCALAMTKLAFGTAHTITGIRVQYRRNNKAAEPAPLGFFVTPLRLALIIKTGELTEVRTLPAEEETEVGEVGTPADLWGVGEWKETQINAEAFGIALWTEFKGEGTITIDLLTVTVWYTSLPAPPKDAVIYTGHSSELRTEGAFRNSGTAFVPVSQNIGDLPRLPPSGLEARPVQLFLKPSEGLLGVEHDSGPTDKIGAQVFYRPCFITRI